MYLELHDSGEEEALVGRISSLDYDYQVEQWIQDTVSVSGVIKWVLLDEQGVRCVWERKDLVALPDITQRSDRFTGTWEVGPNEVTIC